MNPQKSRTQHLHYPNTESSLLLSRPNDHELDVYENAHELEVFVI